MIAIELQFPAGRYHATPWGRHVNEGAVEWPPSPWRLLRALIATWKRTLPELPQDQVEPILRTLVHFAPEYILPPASTGHARHYMPWHKNWKGDEPQEKFKTKVFDTFVVVPRDTPLIVRWPRASLEDSQQDVLCDILRNLNTLGRAESWCEARVSGEQAAVLADECRLAIPLEIGGEPQEGQEIVRLLCPDPESAFEADEFVDRTKKKPKRTAPPYDPDWHLCAETLWLHKLRWSDPPGSRWVAYVRSRDCFATRQAPRMRHRSTERQHPQVVRFALDSSVLPLVTETLPVAEAGRRALIWRSIDALGKRQYKGEWSWPKHRVGHQPVDLSPLQRFTGKDVDEHRLEGHRHAYYLPTDEDGDGRLDHLTVVAREGFGRDEMRAIHALREIRPRGRENTSHPLRVLLLGFGRLDEYRPQPLIGPSRRWVSATPYVATRHAKRRGRDRIDLASPEARAEYLMADLRSQLRAVRTDLDAATPDRIQIEPVWDGQRAFRLRGPHAGRELRPLQFKRTRAKPGDDGARRLAGSFRLIFLHDVTGPISLGWSSHFGMGLFIPEPE